MATQGFASGFNQGFGLVNDVFKRRAQDEYNRERLALAERERLDAAEYRNRMADVQADRNVLDDRRVAVSEGQLKLAQEEATRLQGLRDPVTGRTPTEQAEYEEATTRLENTNIQNKMLKDERDRATRDAARQEAAMALDDAYKKISNRIEQGLPMGDMFQEEIRNLIEKGEGQGIFDVGNMFRFYEEGGAQEIANMMSEFRDSLATAAQGGKPPNFELTPQRASAIESALGLNKSAAIGKPIDSTFTNAPKWMQEGGWTVDSIGLDSVSMVGGKLTGQVYVVAKNAEGEMVPYLAPLTEGRSAFQTKGVNLDFGETIQGMAGYQYMVKNLMPALRAPLEEYRAKERYGSVSAFDEMINGQYEAIKQRVAMGANLTPGIILPGENPNTIADDPVLEEKIKKRLKRSALFGEKNTSRVDVDDWIQREANSLMQAQPIRSSFVNNQGDGKVRSSATSFGQQFPDLMSGADPEQARKRIVTLSGYFDRNGKITDQRGLLAALMDLGLIEDRRTNANK